MLSQKEVKHEAWQNWKILPVSCFFFFKEKKIEKLAVIFFRKFQWSNPVTCFNSFRKCYFLKYYLLVQ